MKKIKRISVRLSQKDYDMLYNDYMWCKKFGHLTRAFEKQEIKNFSDYIRAILGIGYNES